MNALLILFFLTMIIHDYFFKEGYITKIFGVLFGAYYILYLISSKSSFHSNYKHLLLAIFSQSYDPTIYTQLEFEVSNAKRFMKEYEEKTGIKLTWTLLCTKIMGLAMVKHPNFNAAIQCGRLVRRSNIDMSLLINLDGKNLGKKLLRDIDKKSLAELDNELKSSSKLIREGKDEDFKKQVKLIDLFPSFVVGVLLEIVGFLSNLGLNIKSLGVESHTFGSMMITSVGSPSFNVEDGYAPLLGFTHTVGVATICTVKTKSILQKDGSLLKKEVITMNFALDHRYIDGVLGAKLARELATIFKDPHKYIKME
mmetsp:Transcript_23244/g.24181  ORF Transcript_23244/g.24181 Transcript_23244/m.24181 type:complete len:311 (-) Transcript_23244:68-1000(-)